MAAATEATSKFRLGYIQPLPAACMASAVSPPNRWAQQRHLQPLLSFHHEPRPRSGKTARHSSKCCPPSKLLPRDSCSFGCNIQGDMKHAGEWTGPEGNDPSK